ncbi:MAG: hypothetical protein AAFO83_03390 [Cyanobacteria bacterium J06607_13]
MPQIQNRITVNQHDRDWLYVWAGVKEMDIGDQIANLIGFRIRERRGDVWDMVVYAAKRRGMDPQNLFEILRVDPRWLRNNPLEDDTVPEVKPAESPSVVDLLRQEARDRGVSLAELCDQIKAEASDPPAAAPETPEPPPEAYT